MLSLVLFGSFRFYYAALLPRRGPHYASHSVCLSVCLAVRPVIVAIGHVFSAPLASRMYFSARTEGRISYVHLGRTDSCFGLFYFDRWAWWSVGHWPL